MIFSIFLGSVVKNCQNNAFDSTQNRCYFKKKHLHGKYILIQRAFSSCRLLPCFLRMCCLRLISFISRFSFFSVGILEFSASISGLRFSLVTLTSLWWRSRFPCFRLWKRCLWWPLSSLLSSSRRKWKAPFLRWPLRCLLRATWSFGTSPPSVIRTSFFWSENEGRVKMWATITTTTTPTKKWIYILQANFSFI